MPTIIGITTTGITATTPMIITITAITAITDALADRRADHAPLSGFVPVQPFGGACICSRICFLYS